MSSTKLCVPVRHLRPARVPATARSAPAAWVYLSGITPPSSHAVDVIISGGVCGPRPASGSARRRARRGLLSGKAQPEHRHEPRPPSLLSFLDSSVSSFRYGRPEGLHGYFTTTTCTAAICAAIGPSSEFELETEIRRPVAQRSDEHARLVHGQRGRVLAERLEPAVLAQVFLDVRQIERGHRRVRSLVRYRPTDARAFGPAKSPISGMSRFSV